MTQIEIILLALLCENDYYAYEIESIIEQRNMREWTEIGFSSIYNSLKKLEQKGFVGTRFEKEYGSPKRKVYFIMEEGKVVVEREIKRSIQSPKRTYNEFDIGMAFANLLGENELQESVCRYRDYLVKRREHLLKRYHEQPVVKSIPHLEALFTRPLKLLDSEIKWVEEFLNR